MSRIGQGRNLRGRRACPGGDRNFRGRRACPVGALSLVLFVVMGCDLEKPEFGKTCNDAAPCEAPYVCFDGSCVPPDFPLLREGEGEGEGEGE
jgi:hypothetical protein